MLTRTLGTVARGLLLSTALTQSAWPITPDQRAAVMGKIKPVWQWNALSLALPSDGSVTDTSPSLGGLVLDATGQLTYAANNLLTYSGTIGGTNWGTSNSPAIAINNATDPVGNHAATTFTNTTQGGRLAQTSASYRPGGKYVLSMWVRLASGTQSQPNLKYYDGVSQYFSGDLSVTSSWQRFWFPFTLSSSATLLSIYFQDNASVNWGTYEIWGAQLEAVTYQTTPSAYNPTTGSAYYGPKFDYGQGLRSWEQRANAIRNNTMQGAVAGVARTTGSISSISRSGTTTVVVAATGHNVAVDDMITVSGATPSAYNGTYAVSAVSAGVSYSYVCASSATDTASGATVAVVSQGTLPTNWARTSSLNGIAVSVVGVGTDSGLPYIDLRLAGLASTNTYLDVSMETTTGAPSVAGNVDTVSLYSRIVAGSTGNLFRNPEIGIYIYDSVGGYIGGTNGTVRAVGSGSLLSQRVSDAFTVTNGTGTTAYVRPFYNVGLASGALTDFTLRIAAPQLELAAYASPPILTYGSAVTASADSVVISDLSKIGGFNSAGGAFGVEFGRLPTVDQVAVVAEFNSTSFNNETVIIKENSNDSGVGAYLNLNQYDGAGTLVTLSQTAGNDGANHRVIATWGEGKLSGSLDGGAVVSGVQRRPTPTKFGIGSRTDQSLYYCNCYIRGLAFYPNRTLQPPVQQNKSRVGAQW